MNCRLAVLILPLLLLILLTGCVTTEEATKIQGNMSSLQGDFYQFKQDTEARLAKIEKEQENVSKQVVNMYSSVDNRDEKIRNIMGKLDELEYQIKTYWAESKTMAAAKRGNEQPPPILTQEPKKGLVKAPPKTDARYEEAYKEAFDSFQRGQYETAVTKFTTFTETYSGTPLASNAFYWIGESYMNLKNYDKAILYFQEVIDKHPKSEKAPRALLSQAEAFRLTNDKKSSTTLLKRVIELYPKSEEAIIAERKLRNP
ncbi:MAG: tol-pal system protein YbgF [Deltaproteobacteria bacterium]|nr:tol-pal system protein YbgF [Deltaproteobacteria bacterium]